ncbi:hypothetical protein SBRCBS47491_005391 [Sporothrix bragantina]|uniref:Carboxylic ester hydrolase n=1 Tax=Sporothrix bragantina TaxID=671064 RepID=A0ABP0BWB9_9PEZI
MSPTPPRDFELLDGHINGPAVRLPTWESPSVLQTVVGKVSPLSSDLEEFRGIPYGTVSARWEQSQLRTRLPSNVFDATQNGPKCVQPSGPNDSRTYQSYLAFPDDAESEFDCLNLFIVRPSPEALQRQGIAPYARIPVLVWIHGGALAFGAATDPMWDPSRLVLRSLRSGKPIIAVSVTYRLNIFGFGASSDILATQDPTTTGGLNFGIRDQKVALEWIAHNIAAFGGDSSRVTLGGQSAGSVSTHTHLREASCAVGSPFRKAPLFRRVLLHSGALGTLGPSSLANREPGWKAMYEALFGVGSFDMATPKERVARLREVPSSLLLKASESVNGVAFAVVSDGITASELSSSLDAPSDLAVDLGPVDLRNIPARSPAKGIDVLIGVTDLESCIFLPRSFTLEEIAAKFEAACSDATLRAELLQSYGLTASATNEELQQGLMVLMSDAMFEVPCHISGKALRAQQQLLPNGQAGAIGQVQTFHVKTGNPFSGPFEGVAHHCVELIYLFEAFHDAFVEADNGNARPYIDPSKEALIAPKVQTVQEISGTITPPEIHDETFATESSADEKKTSEATYGRTNIELSHAMQDFWLDFIVADDWTAPGGPDSVLVYGKDRSTVMESMTENPDWQTRRQRWDLLAKDPEVMSRLCDVVRQG